MAVDIYALENRLWGVADELRANSDLKASDYSVPVLGLIFLKYADVRFRRLEKRLAGGSGRRKITKTNYQAEGVLYLPEEARYSNLMQTPEGEDIGSVLNAAMKAIERENDELKDVLPRLLLWAATKRLCFGRRMLFMKVPTIKNRSVLVWSARRG